MTIAQLIGHQVVCSAFMEKEAEEHKWVSLDELKKIKKKEGALSDLFYRNPELYL